MSNNWALIDSHAHLELAPLVKDVPGVVQRAKNAGVKAVICVGIDLEDAKNAAAIAVDYKEIFLIMGFHPHNADSVTDNLLGDMEEMAKGPKVVGYGEIGLDYFRNHSSKENQVAVFKDQLNLAKALGKPVVIHLRDAYDQGLDILEQFAPFNAKGVIHCFSGTWDDAGRALELGFYISIPGTVTYKKNDELRAIVAKIPDDRLILETDCPFLAPEPFRGKTNEPALIVHTAEKVAHIRGKSFEELANQTGENTLSLFGPHGLLVP